VKAGVEASPSEQKLSMRQTDGVVTVNKDCAITAWPAVAQTWQTWEPEFGAPKSAHKWNCAPSKASARSKAKRRIEERPERISVPIKNRVVLRMGQPL